MFIILNFIEGGEIAIEIDNIGLIERNETDTMTWVYLKHPTSWFDRLTVKEKPSMIIRLVDERRAKG